MAVIQKFIAPRLELSRLALFWEQSLPLLWPAVGIAYLFLVFVLLDLIPNPLLFKSSSAPISFVKLALLATHIKAEIPDTDSYESLKRMKVNTVTKTHTLEIKNSLCRLSPL